MNMLGRISISEPKYAELQQNTANELHELYAVIQAGWPATKQRVPLGIRQYWNFRDELAVLEGVIYIGKRILVPLSMRPAMVNCKGQAKSQRDDLLARNKCADRGQSQRLHLVP